MNVNEPIAKGSTRLRITNKHKPEDEFVLRSIKVRNVHYEKLRAIAKRTGRTITDVLQIAIENIE